MPCAAVRCNPDKVSGHMPRRLNRAAATIAARAVARVGGDDNGNRHGQGRVRSGPGSSGTGRGRRGARRGADHADREQRGTRAACRAARHAGRDLGPLGLTGTKIACNHGACSACTVWLDGLPVCGCMTLAIEVGTRGVTTIEGLAMGGALHPVQAAFIEHDAMQCGFCTPGMVMSCAALLARTPAPTEDAVKAAISGHVCRCGTYPHVVAATLAAGARKA